MAPGKRAAAKTRAPGTEPRRSRRLLEQLLHERKDARLQRRTGQRLQEIGLEEAELVARVHATAVHLGSHEPGLGAQHLERVSELDLAALAGLGGLEERPDARGQYVAPHDGLVGL